jgi:arginine-tRNA-protein transferase
VTHRPPLSLSQIQYYATAAYPCSYVEGRIARSQVASPSEQIVNDVYSDLVEQGFRRSGGFVYRPCCDHCQACTSIRIPVTEFRPDKSQRRAQKQYAKLAVQISKPHFSKEHYALYQRYQKARHANGGMDHDDVDQYIEFLVNTRVDSYMIEFRETGTTNATSELRMVSIIDQLRDGLSAVYTFFEPLDGQSYGTFNVLWQIEHARTLGLRHVYLGYWIQACRKMSYKTRFQPNELLIRGKWVLGNVGDNSPPSDAPLFFTK